MVHGRSHRMTDVFARLAPGATVADAQSELNGIASQMYAAHPENYDAAAGYAVNVAPLRDALTSNARNTPASSSPTSPTPPPARNSIRFQEH